MNNPLKYTDPSGHFWNFVIGAIISYAASQSDNPYIRTIGMIVGGAMMGGTFGGETLFANAVANKMAVGFVMGGIQGGDLESAVLGAVGAGLTYGIDSANLGFFGTATAHGVQNGIIAEASGGDFKDGFRAGFTMSALSQNAMKMREKMIAQSRKYSYIDPETGQRVYPNIGAESAGFKGDGHKIGGGRLNRWENGQLLSGQDAYRTQTPSPLGGNQGRLGSMGWKKFGYSYGAGSITDYVVEAYAGPHDYLNSPIFYDSVGNIKNFSHVPNWVQTSMEIINLGNVFVATPFVLASITAPENHYHTHKGMGW